MPESTVESTLANPGRISHWFKQLYGDGGEQLVARPRLGESLDVDVCIVGAGYTGLWTAYALRRKRPELSVAILDAQVAGYGASGRNGGAVIAQFNGSRAYWTKRGGREGTLALERAVRAAVDEIGASVEREGIECAFAKNGVIMAARNELEAQRFQESIAEDREWGWTEADSRYLDRTEVIERIRVEGAVGARYNAHCASIHAGALVRGLAETVERHGATIYEGTPVTRIEPHKVTTASGHVVTARSVLRATEAYTESLETHQRLMVPVHTSMLVTEPIPDGIWEEIGWGGREALLAEHPFLHLQHTADHRITIGGDDNRVPYRYGSAPCPDGPADGKVAAMYHGELLKLFPALKDVRIDTTWQGVFATGRNWAPGVGYDSTTGLAWAGGYVGEGVAIANLAGRAVADLIMGEDTELTRLPFVGPPARRWEPEPLRMIGSVAISRMREIGDHGELRTGKPSRLLELGNRIAGFTGHIG